MDWPFKFKWWMNIVSHQQANYNEEEAYLRGAPKA